MKLDKERRDLLQKKFRRLGFTALNFTDSRSSFQFYSLGRLWEDIQIALNEGITLLNVATEPVTAAELYKALTGDVFKNELKGTPENMISGLHMRQNSAAGEAISAARTRS